MHQYPWHCDEGEEIVIEVHHLVNALTKLYDGKIIVDWADCITMREDIEVEDVQISEILTEIACYYGENFPKHEINKYLRILNAIEFRAKRPGNTANEIVHIYENIRVVTNASGDKVITVITTGR